MRQHFGFLNWWPGDTKDEIFIGAILTQQTSWKNVERAISNLRSADSLSIKKISEMETSYLEGLIRPSGYYRQKAKRLSYISKYVVQKYASLNRMFKKNTMPLRGELLSLNGIGKETADSIILYAAGKRVFVIDAYTKRIMSRVYAIKDDIEYDELQSMIISKIPPKIGLYKDFHAQFVELGKNYCKAKPLCSKCPLKRYCLYNLQSSR